MIHPLVKIITIDGFFSKEEAERLSNITFNLGYIQKEFGQEVPEFNMVPENADNMFSEILNTNMKVDREQSGIFRIPDFFIHFESFTDINEWIFAVALQPSTFNIYEHQSGITNALGGYKFNYKNLFEWDYIANYLLVPGQGVLFRPWLFHSFDNGLVQMFKLTEENK